MRIGFLLLLVWFPLTLPANAPECVISFDSARFDVCTGEVELANEDLAYLAEPESFADSGLRVVKFRGPIGPGQRAAVEALGAEILGYAPYHAYVVRMPPERDRDAGAIEGVIWTGPFLPVWKLDINLVNELAGARLVERAGLTQLRVSLQPGTDAAAGRDMAWAAPGVEYAFSESGPDRKRLVLEFDPERLETAIDALAADDNVAAVSLRWPERLMNSQAGWLHQSGQPDLTPVFDHGLFGCGQVVGVLDTGVHGTHCSFEDDVFGQPAFDNCGAGTDCPPITPDFGHRKIGAHYKWSGLAGGPADDHGHGTHVSASAVGNNPVDAVDCQNHTTPGGVSDLDGTAPGARLIAQEAGNGLQYLNSLGGTIYHAAEVAYDNGARLHNNSWGSSCRDQSNACIPGCQVEYRQGSRDADALVWDFPEMAVFVAAGNSGSGCGPGADVGSAGNAKNVFSIGSNVRGIDGDDVSSFSSRGPTIDRRTKPDILAQGGGTTQATAIHSAATGTDCSIALGSGTSMASPTATGLAALIREYLERGFYPMGEETPPLSIPNPSGALIKAMMINSAREIDGAGTGAAAPNPNQGWGRVHLDDVLFFSGDQRGLWILDESPGLQTGDSDEHFLDVSGSDEPLKITLVWHDYPALVNANPHIVNALRLEVETPHGETWTQKLSPGGGLGDPDPYQDTSAGDYDDRNTVHEIRLADPVTGTYSIRVRGLQVAEGGRQPYALAATGMLSEVAEPDFALRAVPAEVDICAGTPATYDIELQSVEDFDDPVDLAVTAGLPGGVAAGFSVNPAVPAHPAATSGLDIQDTTAVATGLYTLEITGEADGPDYPPAAHSVNAALRVSAATPAAGGLLSPPDQATGQALRPVFTWQDFADVRRYRFQLSEDPDFKTLVDDRVVDGTSHTPTADLDSVTHYYWRVAGINPCGQGAFSPVFTFATQELPGDCPLDSEVGTLLHEDFGGGEFPAGWSTAGSSGDTTWTVTDERDFAGGFSAFAENLNTISDQRLSTPPVQLPVGAGDLVLTFRNWQHIESWPDGGCFDGGVLEISTDNGSSWQRVGNEHFVVRDYDGVVSSIWGNPLAGETAWCGDPRDFWERYVVDVSDWAGENARFRFRLGTDGREDRPGWYVDRVEVRSCGAHTVGGTVTGLEGSGLVLENNGSDPLAIQGDGPFTFASPLADGADYQVRVSAQPDQPLQACQVQNGSGQVAGADVTDIVVECTAADPVMDIQPDRLAVRLEAGEVQIRPVEITNTGGETLTWAVSEDSTDPDCQLPPWLEAAPAGGSVESGQSQTLEVTVNGSGMDDVAEASLCLAGNDPDRPLVVVTVRRTVVVFADGFE